MDHVTAYVKGRVHTNGLENFWSLVKRAIHGTYVSIEPFHVFRYLDEQAFRFNTRKANDGQRFRWLLGEIVGKRLTYTELTGACEQPVRAREKISAVPQARTEARRTCGPMTRRGPGNA